MNGTTCASTTCPGYGGCDYSDACDETAMQSRTCTDYRCSAGACAPSGRVESLPCSRTTGGMICTGCSGSPVCRCASGTCSNSFLAVSGACTDCTGSLNCPGGGSCAFPDQGSCNLSCPEGSTLQLACAETGTSNDHAVNAYINGVRQPDCSAYFSSSCTRVVSTNLDAMCQVTERLQ